jgi:tRNA A-37 threonylcarbamoyl transferase component Bud32
MVIVMERILNPLGLSEIVFLPMADKISIFEDIVTAVRTLHERNFVHGDLRWPNILVTNNPIRAYLVDFDISGSEGIAKYPFNLDLECFDWLSLDGMNDFVTKEHDLFALAELKVGLRIRDNP